MKDTEPIGSFEELLKWKKYEGYEYKKLQNYSHDKLLAGEREILSCHDMKGGYLEQERISGCAVSPNEQPYIFLNWWNIDIFCYFSHNFVTIPPISYINAAHEHGCLVMGTFITEDKPGAVTCRKILESDESALEVVEKLVQLAEFYGFEGWLINIENRIEPSSIPRLLMFLSELTIRMKHRIAHSRVIWYDSVTHSGNLHWQNQLNEKNRQFYDACDGIYLNYNWNEAMLLNSSDLGQLNRIYVGIDCFARGCVGGWDCHKPFSILHFLRFSVALFAPGWVAEKNPDKDQIEYGLRFWSKLAKFIPNRAISDFFSTDFKTGLDREKQWYRIADSSVQPHYSNDGNMRPHESGNGVQIMNIGIQRLFVLDLFLKSAVTIRLKSTKPVELLINGQSVSVKKLETGEMVAEIQKGRITEMSVCTTECDTIIEFCSINSAQTE